MNDAFGAILVQTDHCLSGMPAVVQAIACLMLSQWGACESTSLYDREHVETNRWFMPEPFREQCVCRRWPMQAIEDKQHLVFDCRTYSISRGQHFSLFGPKYQQRDIRLFFDQN